MKKLLYGAGSVITKNVPNKSLALERSTQIIKENAVKEPNEIFKVAIERVTGEYFGYGKKKLILDGKEYDIHDQSIYRRCEKFILNDFRFVRRNEFNKRRIEARRKYMENEKKKYYNYKKKKY